MGPPSIPSPAAAKAWRAGMIALVLLAFVLRVWRLDGPYEHFDERIAVCVSQHLAKAPGWDDNWVLAEIPVFSSQGNQYNFSAYLYSTHLFRRTVALLGGARWDQVRDGLLLHRLFSALCGTLAVALLIALGRRLESDLFGAVLGLLAAVCPQLIQDAHYARPEAFMTLLVVAMLWLGFGRGPAAGRIALMGVAAGLLTATKVSNVAFLVLPAMAGWQAAVADGSKWWRPDWTQLLRLATLAVAGFIAGCVVGMPYVLIHWAEYREGLRWLSDQYRGSHPPYSFPDYRPVWTLMRDYFVATHGLPLLVATGVGAAVCLGRRTYLWLGLLAMPLLFYVWLFGSQRVFFERNLSVVFPGALILAVVAVVTLFRWLLPNPRAHALAVLVAALLFTLPGDRVVEIFLRRGVTELEPAKWAAFQERLKVDYPGVRQALGSLYSDSELSWLHGEVRAGKGTLLYLLLDFNDAYKARWLPELEREFVVAPLDEYRGAFADYPVGAFNGFHGPRVRVYQLRER